MSGFVDLVGRRFNRLTVESRGPNMAGHTGWNCRCDCGNKTLVARPNLVSSSIKSCGCLHLEKAGKLNLKHGFTRGYKKTREYRIWVGMRNRCSDPNRVSWPNYGGRGIRVCERWNDFRHFLADMGPRPSPRHSLDRINNDGNYEPGNVRWATARQQVKNRRSFSKWRRAA